MRETVYNITCMALILVCVAVSGSDAWEFRMKGAFDWKYEYYSQLGSNGFFGPYDVSNVTGFRREAAANGWLGIENHNGLFQDHHPGVVTGADASYNAMKLTLGAEARLNEAVSIKGRYRIGGSNVGNDDQQGDSWADVGPGFNTQYVNSLIPGANNPLAYGEWAMLWLTAKTPWGILTYGKRPFAIGCGLQYNSEDATDESLLLVVPYGPLRIGVGFYPKIMGHMDFFDMPRRPDDAWVEQYLFMSQMFWPNAFWDKSGAANRLMAYLNYSSGPLKIGLGSRYTKLHFGDEGVEDPDDGEVPAIDQNDLEGWLFAKYANGAFFINAEIDFFNRIRKSQATESGEILDEDPELDGGGSPFAPQYVEAWRWMVEAGVLVGPAKLALLYAYIPGPDRRHGVLIDRQPTTFPLVPTEPAYDYDTDLRSQAIYLNRHVGNSGVFRPYSLLFAYDYGSGLNCQDLNGNGAVTDASILAARLDYAVAANLNTYMSFMYAERASHGWQWGCIWPHDRHLHFVPRRDLEQDPIYEEFSDPIPTIPDTALGWEIGFGMDWKLLQNFTLNMRAAYWQPGRWFNYACIDKSVTDWDEQSVGNNWGVNPDRSIDPVFGMTIQAVTEF